MQKQDETDDYLLEQEGANVQLALDDNDPVLFGETVWFIHGNEDSPWLLDGREYLIQIMQELSPEVGVMAGAQNGKSLAMVIKGVFNAFRGKNTIHVFDRGDKVGAFINEHLNPILKSSNFLSGKCKDVDNVAQKHIGKGFAYYRGATESSATSVSGDLLILDEFDLMDKHVAEMYPKRLNASTSPQIYRMSNPTRPGTGIHKIYTEGTQYRWHLTCKAGHDWAIDWWRDTAGDDLATAMASHITEDGWIKCPECDAFQHRLSAGHWVAHNPTAAKPTYHIIGLMSPTFKIKQVLAEMTSPDPFKREAAFRFDMGLPFVDETTGLSAAQIAKCSSGKNGYPLAPGGFMAVDVGGVFDVQIWESIPVQGKYRCAWVGSVKGWEELARLEASSGVLYGVIDAQPELDTTMTWCASRAGRWRRCLYNLPVGDQLWEIVESDWKNPNVIRANRSAMADHFVNKIKRQELLFPVDQAMFELSRLVVHCTNVNRVIERDKGGNFVVSWVHDESKPDHQFHCGIYALLCLEAIIKPLGEISPSSFQPGTEGL